MATKTVTGFNQVPNPSNGRKWTSLDRAGEVHGRLTIISRAPDRTHGEKTQVVMWNCVCECGNFTVKSGRKLKIGAVKSCGCLQKENPGSRKGPDNPKYLHGKTNSREYLSWISALSRTTNKKHESYERYGGRGITVCEEWASSFARFLSDMGPRPDGHSLERIDNNKGYFLENCKWATTKEQSRNKSNTVKITINNVEKSLLEWSEISGIPEKTLRSRIKSGWEGERAVFSPVVKNTGKKL